MRSTPFPSSSPHCRVIRLWPLTLAGLLTVALLAGLAPAQAQIKIKDLPKSKKIDPKSSPNAPIGKLGTKNRKDGSIIPDSDIGDLRKNPKEMSPDLRNRLTGNGKLDAATTVDEWIEALQPPIAIAQKLNKDRTRETGTKTKRENRDGRDYTVTEKHYSITETPEEIVTYQPVNGFWLGAIVQQDGSKKGLGSLQEVPVDSNKRAPLSITTDIPGSRSVSVNTPSQTAFNDALNGLRGNANVAGGARTLNFNENYSEQQSAISAGASASYLSAKVSASYQADRYSNNHSISATYIERAFTATADFGGRTRRAAFFRDNFTIGDAKGLVAQKYVSSPDNFPAYVKSITYGRVVVFTLTSTLSESEMKAAFSGSFNGVTVSASANAKFSDKMKNTTFQLRVTEFGGSNNNVSSLIPVQGASNVLNVMRDYLSKPARLSDMIAISYTLNILRDNKLSAMSSTTDYTVTTYSGDPIGAKYKVNMWLEITGSDDGAFDNTLECYGTVRVGGNLWWELTRDNAKIQGKRTKGQTLAITDDMGNGKPNGEHGDFTFDVNYAQHTPFELSVNVRDRDDGSPTDERVGIFNSSIYLPDYEGKEYMNYFANTKKNGKLSGESSKIHIRITKTDDL